MGGADLDFAQALGTNEVQIPGVHCIRNRRTLSEHRLFLRPLLNLLMTESRSDVFQK